MLSAEARLTVVSLGTQTFRITNLSANNAVVADEVDTAQEDYVPRDARHHCLGLRAARAIREAPQRAPLRTLRER